jgi:hypothetical protein
MGFCTMTIPQWENDAEAMTFLRARGYRLTRAYDWIPPANHEPTEQEQSAAGYLFEEWDFGGIKESAEATAAFASASEMSREVFRSWIDRRLLAARLSNSASAIDVPMELARLMDAVKLAREFIRNQQIEQAIVYNEDGSMPDPQISLGQYLDRAIRAVET